MRKLMVVAVALAALQGLAYTTVMSAASEQAGHSKITEKDDGKADLWQGGVDAGLSDVDYVTTHQTRTPANQDAEFTGHSFTVRNAVLADKGAGHTLTWGNEGLFLEKGSWQQWDVVAAPSRSTFAGTVTVTAPANAPFCICPTADGKTDNYNLCIAAKFKSAADTGVYLMHNPTKFESDGYQNSQHLFITGDTTEFFGTFTTRTNGFLEVSGTAFAGSLVAEGGSAIVLSNGCSSVSSLTIAANAPVTACLRYDPAAVELAPFTVEKAFVRDPAAPKVKVVMPTSDIGAEAVGKKLTLVKLNGEAAPSLDDFEIVIELQPKNAVYFLEPQVDEAEKTIYVEAMAFVTMRAADASGYTSLLDLSTTDHSKSTPANWTDNELPHADASYLITKQLRTSPDATATPHLDVFPGKALVFYDGGSLSLKSGGLECSNMVFYCSSVNAYGGPTTQALRGKATIMSHKYGNSTSTTFLSQGARVLDVAADLLGNGTARFASEQKAPTPILLAGDNTGFCGHIQILGTSAEQFPSVVITNANALGVGGAKGVLDGEAIAIWNNGRLQADESLSYFDEQRCFYLYQQGRIGVAAGKTFEIKSRLKVGEAGFIKEGDGTLALGNSWLGFGSGNSGTPQDGTNNLITVNGGALKVTHAEAVNGARITLAEETRIVVGDGLGAKGIDNVKTDVPFATTAADGLVRFAFEGGDASVPEFAVPLCTVTATAADALRGKLVVARPKGYKVAVVETANEDGTVTFVANCARSGLLLILR